MRTFIEAADAMPSTRVPVVIVEEHHEVFSLWHNAIWRGWVPPRDNTLLHVDEHSDLNLPVLTTLPRRFDRAEDVAAFTYQELSIGSFIWPAVVQGIFNRMVWLRPAARRAQRTRFASPRITRWSDGDLDVQLAWYLGARRPSPSPGTPCLEIVAPASHETLDLDAPFVLDIDLDYCSSYRHARGPFELEITASTYRAFVEDPYHFLRLSSRDRCTAHRDGDRYVLRFGEHRHASPERFSADDVLARCDALWTFLAAQRQRPSLITVCRSIHSGYTPPPLAALIERTVMQGLSSRYDVMPVDADDLIPRACRRLPEDASRPIAAARGGN